MTVEVFKVDVPVRIQQKNDGVWVADSAMVKGLLVVSKDIELLVEELVPQALADLAAAAKKLAAVDSP